MVLFPKIFLSGNHKSGNQTPEKYPLLYLIAALFLYRGRGVVTYINNVLQSAALQQLLFLGRLADM